jgi:hypothetical protein
MEASFIRELVDFAPPLLLRRHVSTWLQRLVLEF